MIMAKRSVQVKKTILEMLTQRGYTDIDTCEEDRILAIKPEGGQICAFSNIIDKFNVEEIHSHVAVLDEMKINHAILIYEGTPTSAVKNVIRTAHDMKMCIEIFHADDLQFNITKHRLQPIFQSLPKDKIKVFKEKFGTKLPILLKNDPIVKFYNYRRGDIVKVTRKDNTIIYRIVK